MLKTRDYDLWSMGMEQYLTHTDYALWEVIVNGDAPAIASASVGTEGPIPPKTAKQKLARKNKLKTKITLLLAISDEHLLKFHGIKDAKTLWEAIKARFGGNKESKKMQKTILKQQYENFATSRSEGLDKTYDRNKSDLDTLSMDDLYNNLKVYEYEIKGQLSSSSSSNSWNVAFVSSENTSSTNKAVNIAHEVSTASSQGQAFSLTYADNVMFSFFANQSNSPQLDNEDIEQIDTDYLKEMDLKWRGHFARECKAPRNQGNRNRDAPRRNAPVDTSTTNILDVKDGIEKPVLNNKGRVTGQREIRPVWNNAQRVNHQNKLTHPHPKRKFVPTAVLTKSGQVPVNAVKQSSPRAAASISTARPVNTAAPKSKVNDALPKTYSYFKAHSPVRRAFNQKSAAKTNNLNEKVKTAKVNNVTTAGPKAVVSAAKGNGENAVKSSACWIWRPTGNVIDHTSKDSGSYMLKRFDYVDLQGRLNGCSRHMTGNKSFLTDYQEIDGGFVAFAGSPKGGKITGKGKIRTGKLDFEDVYFVKELKFNLFSVSQMCDKKNSVLFTETECLVLSPDFKLLDESQVLLKVPRQNNMYSFDLKNVVPSGGLTCLFAKATIDESNLWHRRLGHINFKTMNKLVRGNLVRGLPSKLFENDHTCVACQKGKQHKASCKTKLVSSISQPLQMLHMDLFGPTFVRSINHKIYCLVVTDDFSRFSWVFFLATKDETSGILKTFITGIENQINHKVKIIRCDNGTEFKNNDMNQFCGMKGIKREFSVARTPQQNGVAERKNRTLIEAARTMLADSLLPTTFWAEAVNTACYVQNRVLVTKPHNKTPYELLHGSGPDWLFDIDLLTNFMNYEPVTVGNQTNRNAVHRAQRMQLLMILDLRAKLDKLLVQQKEAYANSTNRISTVSPSVSAVGQSFINANDLPTDPLMPDLEDTTDLLNTGIFSGTYDDEDVGAEADLNNLEITMNKVWRLVDLPKSKHAIGTKWVYRNKKDEREIVVRNKARLIAQGYTQEEGTDYDKVFAPVARIEAIKLYLAYASFMRFIMYHMDVKSAFLYGIIEEEVYVCQPPNFEDPEFRRGTIDKTLFIKKDKGDILLVQILDEFYGGAHFHLRISAGTKMEVGIFISQDKYVADILKKFDFVTVKTASTPMEPKLALIKDAEAEDVDEHLNRSMIRSLIDSPFDLEDFSDSDYAGASLDRKSTTGGCQFLGKRLISWQCKKQTIVANSTTEAEYVAAANCYGQVLWIQNQMLDYGFNFMNTKIYIDNESTICIVKNPVFHSKTKHIEIRHSFIKDSYEKKLIQVIKIHTDQNVADLLTKAFDFVDQHNMVACLERTKENAEFHQIVDFLTTSSIHYALTNELSTNIASAVVCLATGQKFNFSKLIFDEPFNDTYETPKHTKNVFTNMKTKGKDFSGRVTPLFASMYAPPVVGGEGSGQLSKPQPPSLTTQPIIEEQIPTSVPIPNVAYEAVFKERDDRVVRASTTVASLDAVQDSGNITKTQSTVMSNDPLSQEISLGDRPRCQEAMGGSIAQTRFEALQDWYLEEKSAVGPSKSTTGDIFDDKMTTIADILMAIRSARPRTTSVVIRDVEEEPRRATPVPTVQSQDKGKGMMVEPEPTLKNPRKPQIQMDEELAQRLFEEEQAQFEREQRIVRERVVEQEVKDAALIEQMEDVQARMDAARKKFFAAQRAAEIRNIPPTRTQLKNQMITYLKHMGKYTHNQLKSKSFKEIQKLYKKEQQWINDFVPTSDDSREKDDSSSKQVESCKKRPRVEHDEESVKKQKLLDDAEKEELRAFDWKTRILTENMMYYQIIRADGSSNNYKIFSEMLDDFNRQDVMDLHRLVKESWRLFDSCGVHVLLMDNGIAIHMMIEKKYPLTQEMLSRMLNRRLEVDHESEMASQLKK
ncbi:putative ribonuclease H-like domain-containing protein [Tanacetum coccineum]